MITPPVAEPVNLAQCLAQCRATSANDDGLFPLRIAAARELCERETHRAFFNQTWRLSLDHFPLYPWWSGTARTTDRHDDWSYSNLWKGYQIQCPKPSLVNVQKITYLDVSANLQTLDPSTYYVDNSSEPGRIVPLPGTYWPYTQQYLPGSVQVLYTAGSYGDGVQVNTCPAKVVMAILLIVASMFENREGGLAPDHEGTAPGRRSPVGQRSVPGADVRKQLSGQLSA